MPSRSPAFWLLRAPKNDILPAVDERVTIRPLEGIAEFRACHAVQKEAWLFPDLLIIPYTQLITISHNGGTVLGAFDGQDLVGFVFGFLGRTEPDGLYLFSQRMGVLPAYQGRGIGERLKWAQRSWALGRGLDRILWTYDPLEAPNAHLNISKLGGLGRSYERDIYGEHDTPLHSHLPTDRFILEWALSSERVTARLSPGWRAPGLQELMAQAGVSRPANAVSWTEGGFPRCEDAGPIEGRYALVEVPADWQGLRCADMALAADWRAKTRRIFEEAMQRGYVVSGYASEWTVGLRRNFYLVEGT